jgi:hypothetical protein
MNDLQTTPLKPRNNMESTMPKTPIKKTRTSKTTRVPRFGSQEWHIDSLVEATSSFVVLAIKMGVPFAVMLEWLQLAIQSGIRLASERLDEPYKQQAREQASRGRVVARIVSTASKRVSPRAKR